ncbi:DciA family protein [Streptomyces sp. NPDC007094]|uniref:DciA family protein n=1 Tax=Streptomyces sp. NPDC007094 TaxID=3155359 RepID=UPI0033D08D81
MTDVNTPTTQPGPAPEPSGADLARIALNQAREAAKQRGASKTQAPRCHQTRTVRRDGREPSGFAAVLQHLMTDRAWTLPAAGGTVLERWPSIAATISPQLADHVQALTFHPETGQLDLLPESPAYATQLRLISTRIINAANETTGNGTVRTIRVLPPEQRPQTGPPGPPHPPPHRARRRRRLQPGKRRPTDTARPSPPTAPPGHNSSTSTRRSRRPPNGSSVNDCMSLRTISPTAARPWKNSSGKPPPSSGYGPATQHGREHCNASPPNAPG